MVYVIKCQLPRRDVNREEGGGGGFGTKCHIDIKRGSLSMDAPPLNITSVPKELSNIRLLERILVSRRISFKKVMSK